MNIDQIDLKAFGHFTNQSLSLNGVANFHIICGPNEAGKTTLWRAINSALFGIPHSSKDPSLDPASNDVLRIHVRDDASLDRLLAWYAGK